MARWKETRVKVRDTTFVPGESVISASGRFIGDGTSAGLRFALEFLDASDNLISQHLGDIVTPGNGDKLISKVENITVPAGTVTICGYGINISGLGNPGADQWMLNAGSIVLPYRDPEFQFSRDQIDYREIAADAVRAQHVAADQIDAGHIRAGAIETDHLTAEAVKADHIDADAIETRHISANAVEAEHIKADAIQTKHLEARAVTASKLLITDLTNLISNPSFSTGDLTDWEVSDPTATDVLSRQHASVPLNAPTEYVVRMPVVDSNRYIHARDGGEIDVVPGEKFHASVLAASSDNANGTARYYVRFRAPGTTLNNTTRQQMISPTQGNWEEHNYTITVPEGYTKMRFSLRTDDTSNPQGNWFFAGIRLRKSVGSVLIEDGAVKAEHIEAETIEAEHISVDAIKSQHIDTDAIEARHIKGDQIEAHHIATDQILARHIDAEQIDVTHLVGQSITSDWLYSGDIEALRIQAGNIAADAIQSQHIRANTITGNHIEGNTLSGIFADLGDITAGQLRDSTGNFLIDLGGRLLRIRDEQTTPQTRVEIGYLGGGSSQWGIRVWDDLGKVILDANGLGVDTVSTDQILGGSITQDKVAGGLYIPEIVDNLPSLPSDNYPMGAVVSLKTDGKLYRSLGDSWTAAISTGDLDGKIPGNLLEDGAIDVAKFAQGIRPIEIVESAPLPPAGEMGRTIYYAPESKLYRDTGSEWTAAVPVDDLSGTITANMIQAGLIEAGAIGADQIAANAISTEHLRIGSHANLINNPSVTGTLDGWDDTNVTLGSAVRDGVNVITMVDPGNSAPNYSDWFEVDPNKTYEIKASFLNEGSISDHWLGFEAQDEFGQIVPVLRFSNLVAHFERGYTDTTDNPQFFTLGSSSGDWFDLTAYILGHSVPEEAVPMGQNADYHYRMPPSVRRIRLLWVNNGGIGNNNVHLWSPTVTPVDATVIHGDTIMTGTVQARHIEVGSLTADRLYSGTVEADKIQAANIAVGAIGADHIGANVIDARHIAAGTITASKLSITDWSNLVANPSFGTGDFTDWDAANEAAVLPSDDSTVPPGVPTPYVAAIDIHPTLSQTIYPNDRVSLDVVPGESYHFSALTASTPGIVGDSFRFWVVFFSADNSSISRSIWAEPTNGGWGEVSGTIEVPQNCIQMQVRLRVESDATMQGTWYFTGVRVRKTVGSVLIEDGAVHAQHIGVGQIVADHIEAGAITTEKLNFAAVRSDNVVASINASDEGIRISGNKIHIDGSVTFQAGMSPDDVKSYADSQATTAKTEAILAAELDATSKANAALNSAKAASLLRDEYLTNGETTIDGGKITTESITALQIAANAIGANHIAARAITTDKLLVGNFDNLAVNGGFETGELYPHNSNSQGSWDISNVAPHGGEWHAVYNPTGQDGTATLNINGPSTWTYKDMHIHAQPGEEYYGEVWVRAANSGDANSVRLRILYTGANGVSLGSDQGSAISPSTNYQKVTVTGIVPNDAVTVRLRIDIVNNGHNSNPLYFDDIFFRRKVSGDLVVDGSITTNHLNFSPVETESIIATINASQEEDGSGVLRISGNKIRIDGTVIFESGYDPSDARNVALESQGGRNMLINSGFEDGDDYWYHHGSSGSQFDVPSGTARSGNRYARLRIPGGVSQIVVSQADTRNGTSARRFRVTPGDVVRYGGWIRRLNGDGTCRFRLGRYDADGNVLGYNHSDALPQNAPSDQYHLVMGSYTVPENVQYIALAMQISSPTVDTDARFDDVFLTIAMGSVHIANGVITADHIKAGSITADHIEAGRIAGPNNTVGIRFSDDQPLPNWNSYIDLVGTGSDPFIKGTDFELRHDGSAVFSGTLASEEVISETITMRSLRTTTTIVPEAEGYYMQMEVGAYGVADPPYFQIFPAGYLRFYDLDGISHGGIRVSTGGPERRALLGGDWHVPDGAIVAQTFYKS